MTAVLNFLGNTLLSRQKKNVKDETKRELGISQSEPYDFIFYDSLIPFFPPPPKDLQPPPSTKQTNDHTKTKKTKIK